MSRRNKQRANSGQLSRYQLWFLVGLALKYKAIPHNKNKRLYTLVSNDGEEGPSIQASAVNALVGKFIAFSDEKRSGFRLLPSGLDLAIDRIRQSIPQFGYRNQPQQQQHQMATARSESSTYLG